MKYLFLFANILFFSIYHIGKNVYSQPVSSVLSEKNQEEEKNNLFLLSAELRPRFEYRQGYIRPLAKSEVPAVLVNSRVRLNTFYQYKKTLSFYVSAQNVNIWGQSPQVEIVDKTGGFSVFQAWGQVEFLKYFQAKVGRQTISLDDERLFGILDWHPAARAHDALSLFFLNKEKTLDLRTYLAYNQNYNNQTFNFNVFNPAGNFYTPQGAQPYQHMQIFWGKIKLGKSNWISVLFNNLGFQNAREISRNNVTNKNVYYMQTFGFNWGLQSAIIGAGATAYYQSGHNISGQKTNAYLLSGNISVKAGKTTNITIATDYVSGNNTNKANPNYTSAFNPLYGTHHKFYGFMDNFYVAPNSNQGTGLWDKYVSIKQALTKGNIALTGHWFHTAAQTIYNTDMKNQGRDLGVELDVTFAYNLHKYVLLQSGYSVFIGTKSLNIVKNVMNPKAYQNWFWLSLKFSPEIFKAHF